MRSRHDTILGTLSVEAIAYARRRSEISPTFWKSRIKLEETTRLKIISHFVHTTSLRVRLAL
jgi:hypothetical protein